VFVVCYGIHKTSGKVGNILCQNGLRSEIFFHAKIRFVRPIDLSADELSARLLAVSETEPVCILDSCGVGHLGSHLLIAGLRPVEFLEITNEDPAETLTYLDDRFGDIVATVFTLSYDFGLKLAKIDRREKECNTPAEPDLFLAAFECLIVHDYNTGKTFLAGNRDRFDEIEQLLLASDEFTCSELSRAQQVRSNFTRVEYLEAISEIHELIRNGETYQTNLTQRFEVKMDDDSRPQQVFLHLRKHHPAPFAAFIQRKDSTVISASPERFFTIEGNRIRTSPIKGTRPRGSSKTEDVRLRKELQTSVKDVAENTMIVDLLRNDLGRVCEYGTVEVEKLCDLEEHPTLFHLVSTISGELRSKTRVSEILRAVFPCGSITGAPKHRTMQIIDRIETADRGLSMGAIGINIPFSHGPGRNIWDALRESCSSKIQLSVAIRTMVVRENIAAFNVGGGIVIDSDPEKEYEESLLKAKALLAALNAEFTWKGPANASGTH
jgi:para-aminobenzoate synthetase component 1